jgi:4-hydroxythreonine-4-phosphate dehydrogenase
VVKNAVDSTRMKPRIGITVGDPAGIGPEIARKAAAHPDIVSICEPVLYGPVTNDDLEAFPPGQLSAAAGTAAYDAVVRAVEDATAGNIAAIATAPINKEAFAAAKIPWRGHTDLLGHLTGASRVAMMFHSDALRVVLATVHIPLSEVPRALDRARVEEVVTLTAEEAPRFGFRSPRLAVCGLNPHAGEHGVIGSEEERVLRPAIDACRERGIAVDGPFPADTIFLRAIKGEFDVVVACYHDQGLIPVKMAAFGRAVNVTLGLPIVRTSVDHGTAFDIAGKGIADPSSMIEAVRVAVQLAERR